jgi:type IV pilus modification protein PilV
MLTKDGKKKNKKRRMISMNVQEEGFTILELLVAMLVLAVGILALIDMQVAAISGNSSANQMTVATTLAQDQIEQLKRLDFFDTALADTKVGNNGTLTTPTNAASFDHVDANNPINESGGTTGLRRYRRFWNVADNTPITGVKTVVVFVYWGTVEGTGLTQHRVIIPTTVGQ